eukprot:gene542-biopygen15171
MPVLPLRLKDCIGCAFRCLLVVWELRRILRGGLAGPLSVCNGGLDRVVPPGLLAWLPVAALPHSQHGSGHVEEGREKGRGDLRGGAGRRDPPQDTAPRRSLACPRRRWSRPLPGSHRPSILRRATAADQAAAVELQQGKLEPVHAGHGRGVPRPTPRH